MGRSTYLEVHIPKRKTQRTSSKSNLIKLSRRDIVRAENIYRSTSVLFIFVSYVSLLLSFPSPIIPYSLDIFRHFCDKSICRVYPNALATIEWSASQFWCESDFRSISTRTWFFLIYKRSTLLCWVASMKCDWLSDYASTTTRKCLSLVKFWNVFLFNVNDSILW